LKLVDANLLLYAYDPASRHHEKARTWFEEVLSGEDRICLAWSCVLAFIRISTNPRAVRDPLSIDDARAIVSTWIDRPNVTFLEPTERHWEILGSLLDQAQARGDLVSDAHLAALAIEHGAVLCTTDRDFSRFAGLKSLNPLTP
jgi:toxin-antitoxin system PIN domain toxin